MARERSVFTSGRCQVLFLIHSSASPFSTVGHTRKGHPKTRWQPCLNRRHLNGIFAIATFHSIGLPFVLAYLNFEHHSASEFVHLPIIDDRHRPTVMVSPRCNSAAIRREPTSPALVPPAHSTTFTKTPVVECRAIRI